MLTIESALTQLVESSERVRIWIAGKSYWGTIETSSMPHVFWFVDDGRSFNHELSVSSVTDISIYQRRTCIGIR